jgi:hypothetical protein
MQHETVAVVRFTVSEEDESQLMAGIIEQFLLEGELAALKSHFGATAAVGERLVHGAADVDH